MDKSRVGLITYSRYPVVNFGLTDYTTEQTISTAVDNVAYRSGNICLLR